MIRGRGAPFTIAAEKPDDRVQTLVTTAAMG